MGAWFEDLPLDFTRDETRTAERLLIAGFPMNMSALRLADDAGLNPASLNQMAPVKFLMREILVSARRADRLPALLAEVLRDPEQAAIHGELRFLVAGHETEIADAAMLRRPSLATLATLPPTVEAWAADSATPQPLAAPGFEKIVNDAAGFADLGVFRLRLAEAEVRTARIDIRGRAMGTGFLVADSLLLTNWHVVEGGAAGAVARFDHSILLPEGGRSVPFAADWLVARSEHEPFPVEVSPPGPPNGRWDFALIRLAEPAGAQAIGPDPDAADADRRGRYALDGGPYDYAEAEPLLIVGHPRGRPIQLSYASPSQVRHTEHRNRVRYQTNTENGSSGSPVFNRDWRVVALHHAGGPTNEPGDFNLQNGEFNQGIPIAGIVAELQQQLDGGPALSELGLG
jgi:hypothetical protein